MVQYVHTNCGRSMVGPTIYMTHLFSGLTLLMYILLSILCTQCIMRVSCWTDNRTGWGALGLFWPMIHIHTSLLLDGSCKARAIKM
jgi:hypothetical protein